MGILQQLQQATDPNQLSGFQRGQIQQAFPGSKGNEQEVLDELLGTQSKKPQKKSSNLIDLLTMLS